MLGPEILTTAAAQGRMLRGRRVIHFPERGKGRNYCSPWVKRGRPGPWFEHMNTRLKTSSHYGRAVDLHGGCPISIRSTDIIPRLGADGRIKLGMTLSEVEIWDPGTAGPAAETPPMPSSMSPTVDFIQRNRPPFHLLAGAFFFARALTWNNGYLGRLQHSGSLRQGRP